MATRKVMQYLPCNHLARLPATCSGNEPTLLLRKDGWTCGNVIVDFHQSEARLLKSCRQHKLFDVACNHVLGEILSTKSERLQREASMV